VSCAIDSMLDTTRTTSELSTPLTRELLSPRCADRRKKTFSAGEKEGGKGRERGEALERCFPQPADSQRLR